MGDRQSNVTLNVQTKGLDAALQAMITYENRILAVAEAYKVTAAEAKAMVAQETRDMEEASRLNAKAIEDRIAYREKYAKEVEAQDAKMSRLEHMARKENERFNKEHHDRLEELRSRFYRREVDDINKRRNLQRLMNLAQRADAEKAAQEKEFHDKRYAELKSNHFRKEVDEINKRRNLLRLANQAIHADEQTSLDNEARNYAAKTKFAQEYHTKLLAMHRQERAERERASGAGREPFLGIGAGFAGQMAGGGFFSGGMFTGRGAPLAMAAVTGVRLAGEQAEKFRESDFAVRRMMTLVGKAERESGNDFRVMRDEAAKLAVTLGITIPESADAMREALTNAIPADRVVDFVKAANQLAMMEGLDVKSAINSIAAIKNAFGMSPKEMVEVPDVLFAAMDRGNVKLGELSGQIGQLSGMAKEAGVSFKEMMAGLANVTLRGMTGNVATTAMRQVMMKIANPTDKVIAEQERIGFRLTPEKVEEMGFNAAIQAFNRAIIASGSTWAKAFSNDVRTLKVIPFLTEGGGAATKMALADQELAIKQKRAAQGAEELLSSDAKKWASIHESLSQVGQKLGDVTSQFQLFLAKVFMGGINPSGATPSGQNRQQIMDTIYQEMENKGFFGHIQSWIGRYTPVGAGSNALLGGMITDRYSADLVQAKEKYGRDFSSRTEVKDYETRIEAMGGLRAVQDLDYREEGARQIRHINDGLVDQVKYLRDMIAARGDLEDVEGRSMTWAESRARMAKKEEIDLKAKRTTLDDITKTLGKQEDSYQSLGKTILAGLEQQFEGARHVAEKYDQIYKASRANAETNWENIMDARMQRAATGGVGKTLSAFHTGTSALKEAGTVDVTTEVGFSRQQKLVSKALGAFSGMGGMDLLGIAKTGVIPYKEQEAFIENVLRNEGLRGYPRQQRGAELRGEFRDMGKGLRGAYSEYQNLPGATPDSGFGGWYEEKMRREAEQTGQTGLVGKMLFDDTKKAEARTAMDVISEAMKGQAKLQETIAENFTKIHNAAEDFGDDVEGAANMALAARAIILATHTEQLAGPNKDTFGQTMRNLKNRTGFEDPFDMQPGGAAFAAPSSGGATTIVTNNDNKKVTITIQAQAWTKEQAVEHTRIIQEALDRGAGTVETHK